MNFYIFKNFVKLCGFLIILIVLSLFNIFFTALIEVIFTSLYLTFHWLRTNIRFCFYQKNFTHKKNSKINAVSLEDGKFVLKS